MSGENNPANYINTVKSDQNLLAASSAVLIAMKGKNLSAGSYAGIDNALFNAPSSDAEIKDKVLYGGKVINTIISIAKDLTDSISLGTTKLFCK